MSGEAACGAGEAVLKDVDPFWEVHDSEAPPLRPYQQKLVDKLRGYMEAWFQRPEDGTTSKKQPLGSALLVLPTGGGKTRVASEVLRWVVDHCRRRAVFVVNRNKLATQAVGALSHVGLGAATALYKAGYEAVEACPVQVTSIQSLRSEARDYPDADVVVIDEAHCALAPSYLDLVRHYKARGAFVMGLSATPMRTNPFESLGTVFKRKVHGPSVGELVRDGYLVPPTVFALDHLEVQRAFSKLKAKKAKRGKGGGRGGGGGAVADAMDVNKDSEAALVKLFATRRMVRSAVEAWRKRCADRLTIAFCINIEHSRMVEKEFTAQGVSCAHIDGSTPERERSQLYEDFSEGVVQVLTSVNVLSEGFDEQGIGCVMLLRPTSSKGLYIQMVGRGLRQSAGKSDCVVLDQSGNTAAHGPVAVAATPGVVPALGTKLSCEPMFCEGCGALLVLGMACTGCTGKKEKAKKEKPKKGALKDVTNTKLKAASGGEVVPRKSSKAAVSGVALRGVGVVAPRKTKKVATSGEARGVGVVAPRKTKTIAGKPTPRGIGEEPTVAQRKKPGLESRKAFGDVTNHHVK